MEEYVRTRAIGKHLPTGQYQGIALVQRWFDQEEIIQINAKLFKDFAQVNSMQEVILRFVIHINSDIPSSSKEGAAVVLYADNEPTEFDLPSKPLKLHITRDTGEEVHLAWSKPKYGKDNVISYIVSFHSSEASIKNKEH